MYTPAGVILFDVPVGLVLLWFFHFFVKWRSFSSVAGEFAKPAVQIRAGDFLLAPL